MVKWNKCLESKPIEACLVFHSMHFSPLESFLGI